MGEIQRQIRWRPALWMGALCLVIGACGEAPTTADKASEEIQLLEVGIAALWNDGPMVPIEGVEVRSIYRQNANDAGERITSHTRPRTSRYHESRRFRGIQIVQALNGDEAWATVDGTLVPVPEKERALLRLHPFLFSVSLLRTLKDATSFELDFKGAVTLENQIHAQRLEVSPIGEGILSKMTIILDFGTRDHLVRRVELRTKGVNEAHILFMDDYRPVAIHDTPSSHMMVAFRLTAYRDETILGSESVKSVTFNKATTNGLFDKPQPESIGHLLKPCVDGRVAFAEIPAAESTDTESIVDELKEWVEANNLQAAGPLVYRHELSADETRISRVFIPIASGENTPKAHKVFAIEQSPPSLALCQTFADKGNLSRTLAALRTGADENGRSPRQAAYEVHFTPDGSTRQIQLLLKEE